MISGYELSFNIKNNETFVYDYITRLKHRNMTFEKKLDKLKDSKSKTSIHKCVDYVEAIEENKKEILFIYDEMKIKMRNEILNLSNKYLKEFLKYINPSLIGSGSNKYFCSNWWFKSLHILTKSSLVISLFKNKL